MYASLVISTALLLPAAPVPRDTPPADAGPPPLVIGLKADATGGVVIAGYIPVKETLTANNVIQKGNEEVVERIEFDTISGTFFLKNFQDFRGKITTADGKPLTPEQATARVKNGASVLASRDGKPISPVWLRGVSPDTVTIVADGFEHLQPSHSNGVLPNTPPPRLALLTTDATGKLTCETNSVPPYRVDEVTLVGGRNPRRGRMTVRPGYGTEGSIVTKPLAEVKFTAYTLTGDVIPNDQVLKQLAGGGLVIVAGDPRLPDAAYLKSFHEDLIVLVGEELMLPNSFIDNRKKRDEKKKTSETIGITFFNIQNC
jgi:hypothetical protein